MTDREMLLDNMNHVLKEWQQLLGLQNWDIRLDVCRKSSLEPGCWANCTFRNSMEQAEIDLLDPVDYALEAMGFEINPEESLVHELLHLMFQGDNVPEVMINRLAKLLTRFRNTKEAPGGGGNMCDHGNLVTLHLPTGIDISVDKCIAPIVKILNENGFTTIASCCGHGKQPSRISLIDGREIFIAANYEIAQAVSKAFPPIA